MVLTVSFVLFPVTGLCLPPSSADRSTNLMPASGHQNHTTSPSASAPFVSAAFASTASRPAFVTIASRPLWDGTGRVIVLIWVKRRKEYFCKWDWTGQIILIRLDNSPSAKPQFPTRRQREL